MQVGRCDGKEGEFLRVIVTIEEWNMKQRETWWRERERDAIIIKCQ